MINTCFVSHDFDIKYKKKAILDQKKLKQHLDCQGAFSSDKKVRKQDEDDTRNYHNDLERMAHNKLHSEEIMLESKRKRALQEMHKKIWSDQK